MADFEQAVALILKHEGGYVHDKNDPGGETNYGISKRAYPNEDIKALTPDRARALYRRDYWDAIRGPELPFPVALVVFDMAVNAGVAAAVKLLQRSVGATVDGKMGPQTIAKTTAKRPHDVALGVSRRRITYYASLDGWRFYADNWTKRTLETLVVAVTA